VSLAADGPSQMGLSDLAFFRALAHGRRADGESACRMMLPADAVAAFKLTELMANTDGLCYMRTHRPDVPILYDADEVFEAGGYKHLEDGEDVAIVASGYMVHVARQAMEQLEQRGLSVSLIDVYSLPLTQRATEEILQIGDDCRGQLLVLEDNFVGGVYDDIAAAAAASDKGICVDGMVLRNIPKSARTPEEALSLVHLGVENVVAAVQKMFDQSE